MADCNFDSAETRTDMRPPQVQMASGILRNTPRWGRAACRSSRSLLPRPLLALGRFLVFRWRRSRALRELASLDSRVLKDIGLRRGDIWAIAEAYGCGIVYNNSKELLWSAEDLRRCSSAAKKTTASQP